VLPGLSLAPRRHDGTACCTAKIQKTVETQKIAIFENSKKYPFEDFGGRRKSLNLPTNPPGGFRGKK